MFNQIKNKLISNKISKTIFIQQFFQDSNHLWINENTKMKRAFEILFQDLKEEHIQFFHRHKTLFIPCEAQLSCAVGKTPNHHLILVFPELKTILLSASFHHGIAILAHELGHVFHQHTEKKVDHLKAQIEADDFAFELGYGEELQDILLEHNTTTDCRVRISILTSKLIEKKFKN